MKVMLAFVGLFLGAIAGGAIGIGAGLPLDHGVSHQRL